MTYDEARPWAKAMRERYWSGACRRGRSGGVGTFRENPSLTALEIEYIVGWVEGGAPEGDAAYLPRGRIPAGEERTGGNARATLDG